MVQSIKNKQLYTALANRGINNITLFKDTTEGIFYFVCGDFVSEAIYLYSFNQQTISEWVDTIVEILADNEQFEAFGTPEAATLDTEKLSEQINATITALDNLGFSVFEMRDLFFGATIDPQSACPWRNEVRASEANSSAYINLFEKALSQYQATL